MDKEKPSLLFLTSSGILPITQATSGAGTILGLLTEQLAKRSFEGDIFAFQEIGDDPPPIANNIGGFSLYLTYRRIGEGFFRLFFKRLWLTLKVLPKISKSDILIFNSPPTGAFMLVLCLAKAMGKKTIWIVHGGIFIENKEALWQKMQKPIITHFISRLTDTFVTVSQALKSRISVYVPEGKIRVIHNAISQYKDMHPQRNKDKNTGYRILFMGRIDKIKGVDILLDAFASFHRDVPNSKLLIAGSGPLEEELKQSVKAGQLGSAVEFCGFVIGDEKWSLINSADVVAVPSVFPDPFPTIVLEVAANSYTPMVASAVGDVPEMLKNGESGLLVPSENPAALCEALHQLYNDPKLGIKLANNAHKFITSELTWEATTSQYESLLCSLSSRGRS